MAANVSQKQRERICRRADNLCENCYSAGDWRGLAIHHKILKGMGGTKHNYTDDELVLLCGKCHNAGHHILERL